MRMSITVGDRGRIVLPAKLRRAVGLQAGDELLAQVSGDGSVRLDPRRLRAQRDRGAFAELRTAESLADELIAERRAEVSRDDVP